MKTLTRYILFLVSGLLLSMTFTPGSFGQAASFALPEGCTPNDYIPKTLIYKVTEASVANDLLVKSASQQLNAVFTRLQANSSQRLFPHHTTPQQKTNRQGFPMTDLSRIYECTYLTDVPIAEAINMLVQTGVVEYAQPRYLCYPLSYIPADPFNTNQYQLGAMKMYEAWDFEKGDSTIVVGITDWGVELTHPDLKHSIFYNTEDPIDGIDNDNDGYTDNYYGWDMGSNDNNPTGIIVHGTYVSGCSSATTDNGAGVSGTGFRCKFLPIKIADDNNNGNKGYEGIVYAADHGCRVINCSWGAVFFPGPFGQDIIDYATFNRNCLVVAACGNDNNQLSYYPASYDHVLSVAGTVSNDERWPQTSYGYWVDLCAPGAEVWTTATNGTYNKSSGTSFSSPLVSGAAALLWSHFPDESPLQIAARLKASCDNIDTIPANIPFSGLLGTGRVNMMRALSDTTASYVEYLNTVFEDADHDHVFESNDTISLYGDFYNFLSATGSGFTATLTSLSPYVHMIDSVVNPGVIPASSGVSNVSHPFVFRLDADVPLSHDLYLKLVLADTNFSFNQYVTITVNSDYLTIDTNQIGITITSKGAIGYNSGYSSQGIGITYNSNVSLIGSAGFLVGISPYRVSDAVTGVTGISEQDFLSTDQVRKIPGMADYTAEGSFNDSLAGTGRMHLLIKHTTMAWNQPGQDKFIIQKYVLKNFGTETLSDLYAGLYIDWDISDNFKNQASWDAQRKLGMIHPTEGGVWGGLQLLEGNNVFYYAFDNDGLNSSIGVDDGFTGLEKYLTLKSNRLEAGTAFPGNDVSHMVSAGPYVLAPGDTVEMAFAILVGDYLSDMQSTADAAIQTYAALSSVNPQTVLPGPGVSVYPCPFTDRLQIELNLMQGEKPSIRLCNYLGQQIYSAQFEARVSGKNTFELVPQDVKPGIYFLEIKTENFSTVNILLNL